VLFASGAAALTYQLLWIKQLSLVVGVDVYAVTIAVGAFFAGLAAGGALFGRLADCMVRPLRLYALLELGVGILGILTTLALAKVAPLFALLEDRSGMLAWVIPFALVGLPAILMGGTYPVLARAVAPGQGHIARRRVPPCGQHGGRGAGGSAHTIRAPARDWRAGVGTAARWHQRGSRNPCSRS
jgi:spermidine synthase